LKEGDVVSYDTIVARTNLPGAVEVVNVAATLHLQPDEVREFIPKKWEIL
jgi:hypothetical protein